MSESIAIVTGGSRGIGRAICEALAAQRWQVVAVARDEQALAATADAIAAKGGRCQHLVCDARDRHAIEGCVEQVARRFGRIDLLVNNAGGGTAGRPLSADEMPDQDWVDMIDLNLTSVYRYCRAVLPVMKAQQSGCIVNVASVAAHVASNLSNAAYTAAKTGMVGLARHLAKEVGSYGIRVNTIAPGIIASERVAAKYETYSEAERTALLGRIPLGRIGRVDEVGSVVAFLASQGASYIHGALIDINGGLFMD
jgi:3-oxoacyl-[acyl-carrier protein] reductase